MSTLAALIIFTVGIGVIGLYAIGKIIADHIERSSQSVRCRNCGHRQPSCLDRGWHYGHCDSCSSLIEDYRY